MKKRGQVTIFMVIGLVILISFGLIFYIKSLSIKDRGLEETEITKTTETSFDTTPIKNYAMSCLEEVTEDALWLVGEHGGYINPDGNTIYGEYGTSLSTSYNNKKIPYYLDGTTRHYLSLDAIEEKLSRYIIVEFENCLNLDTFKDLGFNIEKPIVNYQAANFNFNELPVNVDVSINANDVTVKLEYPLTITKKEAETSLKDFRVNLPIRLNKTYEAAITLANDVRKEWTDTRCVQIYKLNPNYDPNEPNSPQTIPDPDHPCDLQNNVPENVPCQDTDCRQEDDEEAYNINNFNCDNVDTLKLINIYALDNGNSEKIIKIIDYNPFYHKYLKSYVFQFAIRNNPIYFTGNMCTGTIITV